MKTSPLKNRFVSHVPFLSNPVIYSPLAGCSDFPFRKMSRRYGPGLIFCEMVKIDALVRHDPNTYRFLDYEETMHPIGAQVCGSKPVLAKDAARIIEDLGFDVLDFNCGCPVDKVTKDGSGSGMLKTPEKIGEILFQMVSSVQIPVTVKIRAGWDEDRINAPLITKIAEQAGAKAIAVHGRTREQGYKGAANWDYIKACKEVAQKIYVFGNGDIFDGESACRMLEETGCDAILVSRGTLGKPWIAEDIMRAIGKKMPIERPPSFVKETLLEHFSLIVQYQPERKALLDMRRVGCWYLKEMAKVKELRMQINKASSTKEVFAMVENFAWEKNPLALSQNSSDG